MTAGRVVRLSPRPSPRALRMLYRLRAFDRPAGRAALMHGAPDGTHVAALARMGLARPRGITEHLEQRLVVLALDATR